MKNGGFMFYFILLLLLNMSLTFFAADYDQFFDQFINQPQPIEKQHQPIGHLDSGEMLDESLCAQVIKNAPEDIKQLIANLKHPSTNKQIIPRRLLLLGPPGVGKTTLAKAIAKEIGRPYYFIEAPFLLDEYKNSGIQNLLREIKPILQRDEPCVIIIDELTELTDQYNKDKAQDSNVAAALWLLLDQCATHPNILFIGTSNKKEHDLPAQIRSRFEENIIHIDPPNKKERAEILRHHFKHDRVNINEKYFNYLLKKTTGKSARALEKLFIKAAQHANGRLPGSYCITAQDFDAVLHQWQSPYHPKSIYEKIKIYIQPFNNNVLPPLNFLVALIGLGISIYSLQQSNQSIPLLQGTT
ncbi:MAG TPA: AAA family ATPase [Candidatus Dependentiae bacterium]|nr:AAA family ATPase [Candidatus Dependentiae bacterium]